MSKQPEMGRKVYLVYESKGKWRVAPAIQTEDGLVLYSSQVKDFNSQEEAELYKNSLNAANPAVILASDE